MSSAAANTERDRAQDKAAITERIQAFVGREPRPAPVEPDDSAPADSENHIVPEVEASEFDGETLDRAIASHGAIIVRGLFTSEFAERYRALIDGLLEASQGQADKAPDYDPPEILKQVMTPAERVNGARFRADSGCLLAVEAPAVANDLLDAYRDCGLREIIAEHLGEEPCVSVKKWVLRRSVLPVSESGWHQDGAFMGKDIRTINLWISLSHCGAETGAPGMDVIPRRLRDVVSSSGAQFEWAAGDPQAQGSLADSPPVAPEFSPGDAFFFDHLYLHRTQFRSDFTRLRYAIETWFFGSDSFASNQIPMRW